MEFPQTPEGEWLEILFLATVLSELRYSFDVETWAVRPDIVEYLLEWREGRF